MSNFEYEIGVFRRKGIRNMQYVVGRTLFDILSRAQTPQTSAKFTGGTFVQGKIPVLTERLRNSLMSGANGAFTRGPLSFVAVTAAVRLGDVITFRWDTPYALRIERGFRGVDILGRSYNQAGRFYMGKNLAMYPQFLAQRAAEVLNKK